MANQKAQMHTIALNTMNLCMNKFNADITPYDGFNKLNSPFYGDVLSPFYSRKVTGVSNNGKSFVSADGTIYMLSGMNLRAIEDGGHFNNSILGFTGALTKETRLVSGNAAYSEILSFIEPYGETTSDLQMLCANRSGDLAVINSDGTIASTINFSQAYEYKPGSRVHFAKRTANGRLIFGYGRYYFYYNTSTSNYWYRSYSSNSEFSMSAYCLPNDGVIFCVYKDNASTVVIDYQSPSIAATNQKVTISQIVGTYTGGSLTVSNVNNEFNAFINSTGNALFFKDDFNRNVSGSYRVYHFGKVASVTNSGATYTLNVTLNDGAYSVVPNPSAASRLKLYVNDKVLYAVVGNKVNSVHVDAVTAQRSIPIESYKVSEDGEVYRVVDHFQTVEYTKVFSQDNSIGGNWCATLLDGNLQDLYSGVGILSDGSYQNGFFASIGDCFRVLYNNGEATAVSATKEQSIMGSLLCGYTELNSNYPISYKASAEEQVLCYRNVADEWQIVKITANSNDLDLTVIDNRYIVINANDYYNCYDTKLKKPAHFAPDYNNRLIDCAIYSTSATIDNLSQYISNCEQWNWGTGQGSNYIAQNTPFISALFAQQVLFYPKGVTQWKVLVKGSYTPDSVDIDLYRSKLVDGSAKYRYSVDQSGTYTAIYINSILSGSVYNYQTSIYIPTIFAKFVNGFVNQGIIIDNGHSYLQLYANNTKPVFGIKLVDQLEGVTAAFIIQGQYFVVINGAIYRYDSANYMTAAVVNIGSMQLVGYTPYQALFWSATNKTFYTFTGDNTLNALVQATDINTIYATTYNPNTMCLYVLADDGAYIFGTNQLIHLEISGYSKCFYLDNGAVFVGTDALYLAYNKTDGYDPLPIELETKLYGLGDSVKSINDCVYLRLFDEDRKAGEVKLACKTLNETVYKTEEKTFIVTKEMWDKASNTLFLRYQPRYQAGTGFSVAVTSPFAIATLQISSIPETVQNSKYNQ